jgi:hypothetical protein
MKIILTVILASVLALAGCGISSKSKTLSSSASAATNVAGLSMKISDAARIRMRDNPGFKEDQLQSAITGDLTKRKLLLPSSTQTLDVNVTDLRVRNGAAVYFAGVFAGNDFVVADVIVKDAAGKTVKSSQINVTFRLASWGSMGTAARNAQMYETFARHVAAVVDPSISVE